MSILETELNNSIAQANTITFGNQVVGNLGSPSDLDYFKFTVTNAGILEINFNTANIQTDWVFDIIILNSSGVALGNSSLGYSKNNTFYDVALPNAGTYYAEVRKSNLFVPDSYNLSISLNGTYLGQIEKENNDTTGTANPLSLGSQMMGQLQYTSDPDFYSLNLSSQTSVYVYFFQGLKTSFTDEIKLIDASGKQISSLVTSSLSSSSLVLINNLIPGKYFIEVTGKTGYCGDNYLVEVQTFAPSNLTTFAFNTVMSGEVTQSNVVKLYSVNLIAGLCYEFYLAGKATGYGSLTQQHLSLFDSSGNVIINSGTASISNSTDLKTDYFVQTTGTYFLAVSGSNTLGTFSMLGALRAPGTLNEIENNNTLSTANPIVIGDTVNGNLNSASDIDYYKIYVSKATVLEITSSDTKAYSNWTYNFSLSDSNNNNLADNSLGYEVKTSTVDVYLPAAGYYTIKVYPSTLNYTADPYTFSLKELNPFVISYELEPNSKPSTATPLRLGVKIFGQESSSVDIDYYAFTLNNTNDVFINFASPESKGGSFTVSLIDAKGNVNKSVTTNTNHDSSLMLFQGLSPGNYNVLVTGAKGYDGSNYNLIVNTINPLFYFPVKIDTVYTNNLSSLTPVTLSSVQLTAGRVYEFHASGFKSSAGSLTDPNISILSNTLNTLKADYYTDSLTANVSSKTDPQIGFIAPYTGTFYFSISSQTNTTGSFSINYSQNNMDSLINDIVYKYGTKYPNFFWKTPSTGPLVINFCFLDSNPSNDSKTEFLTLNEIQKTSVKKALDTLSQFCNVIFVLTTDQNNANIRYGNASIPSTEAGEERVIKYGSGGITQSDIFFNRSDVDTTDFGLGGYGFQTILHETLHSLGLKHPGNYNGVELNNNPPYAPPAFDNQHYTIMSYINDQFTYANPQTPGMLDIAALQSLYGPPVSKSLTVFTIQTDREYVMSAPIGALGSTVDGSRLTSDSIISLTPGTFSSMGVTQKGNLSVENIYIPLGSQYTQANCGSGSDLVICNDLGNVINLGIGSDTVIGGIGFDTVNIPNNIKNFNYTSNASEIDFTGTVSGAKQYKLLNIERVRFLDSSIAFDINSGNAGIAVEILGVIFGKTFNNNQKQTGQAINFLDSGKSPIDLAKLLLNTKYPLGVDNQTEIKLLYQNLLNVQPSSSDLSYWSDQILNGTYTQSNLALMASQTQLNLTNVNLSGLQQTGLIFSN